MCVNADLHLVFDGDHLFSHLPSSLQIALIMLSSYVMQALANALCWKEANGSIKHLFK